MSSNSVNTGNKQTGGWVRRNTTIVLTLPPPSQEWVWYNLPDRKDTPDPFPESFLDIRSTLTNKGVIEEAGVDVTVREKGTKDYRTLWTVKEAVWEYAVKHHKRKIQSDATLPCGHAEGFWTVDADAGIYECGYDYCTERFDRETIEAVSF